MNNKYKKLIKENAMVNGLKVKDILEDKGAIAVRYYKTEKILIVLKK